MANKTHTAQSLIRDRLKMISDGDALLGIGMVAILSVMLLPLPSTFLDVLLIVNLSAAFVILLTAVYSSKPLDFAIFPSLLLVTTLFRIALAVAATRLVLLHGDQGSQAAGLVIHAFGSFVVGGNYVGLELGQTFARLGSAVTLIEALDRLAPNEEPEISEVIAGVLVDEGAEVWTSAALAEVSRQDGKVSARTADGREVLAEAILMATGRRPVTAGLGLEAVGVESGRRGEVVVDDQLRTANPRIWAAGDVTGAPQFVYVAGSHGTMVVENAFEDAGRRVDYSHLPRVTFTTPNIAAVGLTDAEVGPSGLSCTCRVLPLSYVPRAIVNRDTRGVVKIVAEVGTGRVVGIHMIGANAGDAILAATYALEANMTVDQLAHTWAPYLTMAEGIKLAAQSFSTDVAKLSCCAA